MNITNLKELQELYNEVMRTYNDLKDGTFSKKVAEEAATYIYEDINVIFNTSVSKWYSDFKPKYYKRNNSFFDVFEVRKNGTKISWDINPEAITQYGHRVDSIDSKYIWRNMFVGGWHGGAASGDVDQYGAPFPGPMALRTPVPRFASEENKPYSHWSSMKASYSTSPSSMMEKNLMLYQNGNKNNFTGSTLQQRLNEALDFICLQYPILSD